MIRKFFAFNQRLCKKIEPYLPQNRPRIYKTYSKIVGHYMNLRPHQIVVDIGGGKSCSFRKYRKAHLQSKIIAVDISAQELEHNDDVDEKRVADAVCNLPFAQEEVDMIVSRSVLEHLNQLELFIANAHKILKTDGHFIHLFPSKFAPFAVLNQILPHKLAKTILYLLREESKGIGGFPALYDQCYYRAIKKLLLRYNFEIVEFQLSYYQSRYFSFLLPLFLASALYEICIRALNIKNLSAFVLVVARKK